MINVQVDINGITYNDFIILKITRAMEKNIATGNFNIDFPSPYGRHATDFTVGTDIEIYADKDTDPATTKIFTGVVEKVDFSGKEANQKVVLTGRDYSARLQDITAQPSVYTDSEVSTIVIDLINQYVPDITTTNVNVTTTTLERISFNHKTIFDSFNQLAELSNFYFYVDEDKDLHFERLKASDSGITFDNTNILKTRFNQTREGMANQVWVYGDRMLVEYMENFSGDGGSAFTLEDKPSNVYVEVDGSAKKGGIWNLNQLPLSGTDYLIDYQGKNIIFISGTFNGDNIPSSGTGTDIDVTYARTVPIAKFARNSTSISVYGLKEKVISDKNIKDPDTADKLAESTIQNSNPFKGLEIEVDGWFSLTPGQTVSATLSDFDLSESDLDILSINYLFNKKTVESEHVLKLKVDKKIPDITDRIKDIDERLRRIEAPDLASSEILTRLEFAEGEAQIVGSSWKVSTRNLTGDVMIWGNGTYGTWGVDKWGTQGSAFGPFSIVASGGYVY